MSRLIQRIKDKPILGVAAVAFFAFLGWLAFGFFGIQAAFIDNEVDEDGPIFASGAELVSDDETSSTAVEQTTDTTVSEVEEDPENGTDETVSETTQQESETTQAEPDPTVEEPTTSAGSGQVVTIASGAFEGLNDYQVSGTASVLNDGSEQRFLRFDNFDADNGPDLKVYLRAANGDFVNLGELKGNIGSQNYEIPVDVDLDVYSEVDIWCERFSVGFGRAPLT